MKRIRAFFFFEIGSSISALSSLSHNDLALALGSTHSLLTARDKLKRLLYNDQLPIGFSREIIKSLIGSINSLVASIEKQEGNYEGKFIELRQIIRKFVHILEASVPPDIFYINQKGAYSTETLMGKAESLLPNSVHGYLPPEALNDIREGGRAMVFDLPTAAGFHFMRATESVLHKYFDVISTGTAVAKPPNKNMGKYIEALEALGSLVDPGVLLVLRQIKNLHRNPLMHPDSVLDEEDLMTLLGICQSAIVTMIRYAVASGKAGSPSAPSPDYYYSDIPSGLEL